jgi:hypothetical protein
MSQSPAAAKQVTDTQDTQEVIQVGLNSSSAFALPADLRFVDTSKATVAAKRLTQA